MSDFDSPTMPVDEEAGPRSASSRFADLGDRLARTFGAADRRREDPPRWEAPEIDYREAADTMAWEPVPERFPVVQHGYDQTAVDEEIAALERELGELRARRLQSNSVDEEINRIGQQTASILRTAYEQAHEITHTARTQADKCMADAAANAVAITEDANRRLRELDGETESVWQERARLIEDARNVATELFSLAEGASERFREDLSKTGAVAPRVDVPKPVVPEPMAAQPTAAEPTADEPVPPKHAAADHLAAVPEPFDHEQSEPDSPAG